MRWLETEEHISVLEMTCRVVQMVDLECSYNTN